MPSIPITTYEAGDAMVAADVNGDFTDFQAYSGILDDDNTRTEWCSRFHMDSAPGSANFINGNFAQIEDSDTTMVVNSNVFSVVALVPNFRISYLGLAFAPGETMRMHFDVNTIAASGTRKPIAATTNTA